MFWSGSQSPPPDRVSRVVGRAAETNRVGSSTARIARRAHDFSDSPAGVPHAGRQMKKGPRKLVRGPALQPPALPLVVPGRSPGLRVWRAAFPG